MTRRLVLAALLLIAARASADSLEVVWVNKTPTLRYKPDLSDWKRGKGEYLCLVVLLGPEGSLLLDETKVTHDREEVVGWNPKNRSVVYFSRAKDRGGLFEGYQFVIYDEERRLIASDRAIEVPLVAPSGSKIDWAKLGKRAKVFATYGTFTARPAKEVGLDPKDPPEIRHAHRRGAWAFSRITVYTPSASTEFDTTPPAKAESGASEDDERKAADLLSKARFISAAGRKDEARTRLEEILKKHGATKAADEAARMLDKLKRE